MKVKLSLIFSLLIIFCGCESENNNFPKEVYLKVFTAIGHGGQFVLCIPELEMVIATNANSDVWWEEANLQELKILNLIEDYIIPAAE